MNRNNNRTLLTAEEVSDIFRIPLPTIYRLTQQGKIRAIKIGKHWRYRKEDIERHLDYGTDFRKEHERTAFFERRAFQRINANFKCRFSTVLPPFKETNSKGIIKNLSAGGAFICGNKEQLKAVEIDDPIDMRFVFDSEEVLAYGKAVRKTGSGFGMKFKDIDKVIREKIDEFAG